MAQARFLKDRKKGISEINLLHWLLVLNYFIGIENISRLPPLLFSNRREKSVHGVH